MDINKIAAWANVGSFAVGCIAVYLLVWPIQHSQVAEKGTVAQPMTSLHLSTWIFLFGLIVAGLLHFSASVIQSNSSKRQRPVQVLTTTSVSLPTSQVEGRTFVGADIVPKFLCGFFDQYMHVQAERLVAPYIGMWMRVSGTLANVRGRANSSVLVRIDGQPTIMMTFDKQWFERLTILVKGNKITVIGVIEQVDSTTLEIKDCELVSG